jgi:Na+-translocating ferredoxin:NAD+ oxidoreductase RnfG subunit
MSTRDWSAFLLPLAVLATPAQATDYLSVAQAQTLLFPAASNFNEQTLKFDTTRRDAIKAASGLRQRWDEQKAWRAERDGALLGWLLVDEVVGKHEFITYATAISPDGHVLGVEILSYRETHGGQVRDAGWRKRFLGKTLADPFKLDEDIPNISGATLSCRNVTDGVKRLLAIHKLYLAKA